MSQNLREVPLDAVSFAVFQAFERQTPLLAAGDRTALNTMTIGWGGLGTLWKKPVCTVYVRPQRYTYGFMERSAYFTVSFLGQEYQKVLQLCGSKSGREIDKVQACGLTPAYAEGDAPYFEEASLVLVCRKLYQADLCAEQFVDADIDRMIYPGKDYHRAYIGEVVQALQK